MVLSTKLSLFLNRMQSIAKLALPFGISNVITLLMIIINTINLGLLSSYNLYVLALFLPVNYFQIAILEALRAPVLAFAAIFHQQKQHILFYKNIISLIILAGFIALLSTLLFFLTKNILAYIFDIPVVIRGVFAKFTGEMLLFGAFVYVNYILNSIFYGVEKPNIAMAFNLATAIINCSLTCLLGVRYRLGIDGLIGATIISNFGVSLVALIFLKKLGIFKKFDCLPGVVEWGRVIARIKKIASPVWCSYIVLFFTLLLFNKILSHFGTAAVSGFGVAYRLQTFIILPAIAIGMAMAILINRYVIAGEKLRAIKILHTGIFLALVLYLLISPLLYLCHESILLLTTRDHAVLQAANAYLSTVIFSYVGLGPLLAFLITLDQTGCGVKSLFYSVAVFALECGVGGGLAIEKNNVAIFYQTIACINFLSLLLIFFDCFMHKKYLERLSRI